MDLKALDVLEKNVVAKGAKSYFETLVVSYINTFDTASGLMSLYYYANNKADPYNKTLFLEFPRTAFSHKSRDEAFASLLDIITSYHVMTNIKYVDIFKSVDGAHSPTFQRSGIEKRYLIYVLKNFKDSAFVDVVPTFNFIPSDLTNYQDDNT